MRATIEVSSGIFRLELGLLGDRRLETFKKRGDFVVSLVVVAGRWTKRRNRRKANSAANQDRSEGRYEQKERKEVEGKKKTRERVRLHG